MVKDMPDRLSSLDGWVDKFIVDSCGFSGTWSTIEDELFCLEHLFITVANVVEFISCHI
jgi:hypothetical protein